MDTMTIADFVEAYADAIFGFNEKGQPIFNPGCANDIRQRLILIFSDTHTLKANDATGGLLIPGGKYQLLDKRNVHAPEWLVVKDANHAQGQGEYCLPLCAFLNAFADSALPTHDDVVA